MPCSAVLDAVTLFFIRDEKTEEILSFPTIGSTFFNASREPGYVDRQLALCVGRKKQFL
jgi:hypothetical protein